METSTNTVPGMGMVQTYVLDPLQAAWTTFLETLTAYAPSVLGAILILFIGWVIARLVQELVLRALKAVSLDKAADWVQLSSVLAKGGIRWKVSELIAAIIYWVIVLAFVVTALNALNLTVAAGLVQQVVGYLPKVVAAVFLLVIGIFAAAFVGATVRTAASNAGILQAHLLGSITQTVVVAFSAVAALELLDIAFVGKAFEIVLAGVSLGCALAFGLGCKDQAGRWVSSLSDQIAGRKR